MTSMDMQSFVGIIPSHDTADQFKLRMRAGKFILDFFVIVLKHQVPTAVHTESVEY